MQITMTLEEYEKMKAHLESAEEGERGLDRLVRELGWKLALDAGDMPTADEIGAISMFDLKYSGAAYRGRAPGSSLAWSERTVDRLLAFASAGAVAQAAYINLRRAPVVADAAAEPAKG